jgi:hypothetical protein
MLTVAKLSMVAHAIVIVFTILLTLSIVFVEGAPFVGRKGTATWAKIISAIVLLATVFIAVRKETYLPFLGAAAFPARAIKDDFAPEKSDLVVNVDLQARAQDGDKVVYWASKSSKADTAVEPVELSPWTAYDGSDNCGVATVRDGRATLRLKCPSKYKVGYKTLKKHVHYRIVPTKGVKLVGEVHTVFVDC